MGRASTRTPIHDSLAQRPAQIISIYGTPRASPMIRYGRCVALLWGVRAALLRSRYAVGDIWYVRRNTRLKCAGLLNPTR